MAQTSAHTAARRALLAIVVITVALMALLAGAHQWGGGRWTPKLGLDLEGGTQMVLEPRLVGSQSV
ncbi:MAG TPA: protein translocase subunit SecD, partial [Phycicoccus sp.]|nr:protein translocase subunit SecD [Phycicoccus sp.]